MAAMTARLCMPRTAALLITLHLHLDPLLETPPRLHVLEGAHRIFVQTLPPDGDLIRVDAGLPPARTTALPQEKRGREGRGGEERRGEEGRGGEGGGGEGGEREGRREREREREGEGDR